MESTRTRKISRLIQKELAEIFLRESKTSYAGKMISVTIVRVTPDLSLAKVYLSIFPLKKDEDILSVVNEQKSHLRNLLGQRVKNQMRKIPELAFYIDDSLDYIDHIDQLLKS